MSKTTRQVRIHITDMDGIALDTVVISIPSNRRRISVKSLGPKQEDIHCDAELNIGPDPNAPPNPKRS